MANLVLPVPHQAQFFLRAPLRGGEALRAARAPGKLARSWWSGPAACTPTPTEWRWLWRAGKSCVHGAPRSGSMSGSRRLEAERLGRFDRWGRTCWTWTRGGAGGRVAGRRRDWSRRGAGRCSVTAGSTAARLWWWRRRGAGKLRSRADAGRTPSKASSGRPTEVLHHSARKIKSRR